MRILMISAEGTAVAASRRADRCDGQRAEGMKFFARIKWIPETLLITSRNGYPFIMRLIVGFLCNPSEPLRVWNPDRLPVRIHRRNASQLHPALLRLLAMIS
jgi:hypothetical protein